MRVQWPSNCRQCRETKKNSGVISMSVDMLRGAAARALCVLSFLAPSAALADGSAGSGEVLLSVGSENFNTLNATGTSSVLPDGWYLVETGSGSAADGNYVANNGDSNTGNVFSYGANGSNERALGTLLSGSNAPIIGAKLRNNTGATMSELAVSYTGEMWRLGATGRTDRLDFQFSTDATSLTTGTWTDVNALDFETPNTGGSVGPRDGNAAAYRMEISGVISGLTLAPNAVLWVRWVDYNASGNDDGLAIDDVQFGSPVDNPPTLVSSIPEDGDDDFPADASIVLGFSEPVSVSGVWFTLVCDSGLYFPANSTVTGGPLLFFISPNTDLVPGDECTLSLAPALIVDLDGDPDPLVYPGEINFTVGEPLPNPPPQLLSTVPVDGATNFPSAGDLKAVFSEEVTVQNGAFTLTCSTTTGITLVASSTDNITWILDTGTALVSGETCSFVIHAEYIHDLDGAPLLEGATIQFTVFAGADTSAYYQYVNLATPGLLRCSIYETIKGHTKYPYSGSGTNTWTILNLADEDPVDNSKIWDVYKNESYTKITGGTGVYNREHTWPNSLGFPGGGPGAYTDTHMLHLTNTTYNSNRGNKYLANCNSACTQDPTTPNHGVGGSSAANSNWRDDSKYEVWDFRKGDIARAVMYMALRYQGENGEPRLELTNNPGQIVSGNGEGSSTPYYMGLLSDLLEWNAIDPPTDREVIRNGIVQSFQNNRNPLTDHPEWASMALFTTPRATPCVLNQNAPVAAADSYSTAVNTVLTVTTVNGVLANDSDVEFDAAGAALSAKLISGVANGTLSFNPNGSFTYTPNTGYCGTDSFSYRATDGTRDSTVAQATITVGTSCSGNQSPTANAQSVTTPENTAVAITLSGSDSDGTIASYAIVTQPQHGTLTGTAPNLTYTPAAGYFGADSFTFTVTDNQGATSAPATVSISIIEVPDEAEIFADGFEQ